MRREPTITDMHLIDQCINILHTATEKGKGLAAVDVSFSDGETWNQRLTFQRKATPTVMPEVFNYQWECIEIETIEPVLKIVKL